MSERNNVNDPLAGRRLFVNFEVGDDPGRTLRAWFEGTITDSAMLVESDDEQTLSQIICVKFKDGDVLWLDSEKEHNKGRIEWPEEQRRGATRTKRKTNNNTGQENQNGPKRMRNIPTPKTTCRGIPRSSTCSRKTRPDDSRKMPAKSASVEKPISNKTSKSIPKSMPKSDVTRKNVPKMISKGYLKNSMVATGKTAPGVSSNRIPDTTNNIDASTAYKDIKKEDETDPHSCSEAQHQDCLEASKNSVQAAGGKTTSENASNAIPQPVSDTTNNNAASTNDEHIKKEDDADPDSSSEAQHRDCHVASKPVFVKSEEDD